MIYLRIRGRSLGVRPNTRRGPSPINSPGVALAAIVDELFTVLTQHRHLFWLLDRCAAEVAELAGLYETAVRGSYFTDFTQWNCHDRP